MSYVYHEIILILILLISSADSCWNTSYHNVTFGHIENWNFYLGESQPKNLSCSWIINNNQQSYYIISLRILQVENNQTFNSNELLLKTDQKQIILTDLNQRIFYIPSSSALQIYFRPKTQLNSLNIQRFLLEFISVNNNTNTSNYFRCLKTGLIIPKQWKCNCLYECAYDDYSDEENCPLCSIVKPYNSLLCHSNETWCLPVTNQSEKIEPKGVCIPHGQPSQCTHSATCETIISYYQNQGEIVLDNTILSNHESLCLVIIAREKHKIKLSINQYNFFHQRPDLQLLVYDGSEEQNQLLISSNWLSMKQTVQTNRNHIATIVIRNWLKENQHPFLLREQSGINTMLLNMTWMTSVCPDNEMMCGGHFESKCYTTKQRCDGIWDCISGDDELGCYPSSCPTTFACNDPLHLPSDQPRCYTWYERCNGNAFCANRTDERDCTNWWCNSNNGTFLCKNLNCIYEIWACDGTDDCGDNSDETNCPSRIPRRIVTAAVIGATICCTLFIIALGCTCKLFHLRSAERHASVRLSNPQRYIEQRREELQRHSNHRRTSDDSSSGISEDTRRIAPPSYNQTMGFSDDNEERQAFLAEHLRLAGLANFIPLPSLSSDSRTSRHRSRRHRRHRRRHHHHHQRRTASENSHVALLESIVAPTNPVTPTPSNNRFSRLRSQFQLLFTTNLSVNNNSIPSNEFAIHERSSSSQPIIRSTRSCLESRELPPPYAEEHFRRENDIQSSVSVPTTTSTRLIRIRKAQIPLNPIREQQTPSSSSPTPVVNIEDDEQASSDDDDDEKMLVP